MSFFKCSNGGDGFVRYTDGVVHEYSSSSKQRSYTYTMQENTTYSGLVTLINISKNTDAGLASTETLKIETYDGSTWNQVSVKTGTRPAGGSVALSTSARVSKVKGIRLSVTSTDEEYYNFSVRLTA